MPVIPAQADIQCPAEKIFDLIIDFSGQDRWLATSSAFHGTTEISSDPVTLGTTYTEPRPFGVRHGTVTEFERPAEMPGVTRVGRIGVPRPLKLVQPVLVRAFRAESGRTLAALKAYADTPR